MFELTLVDHNKIQSSLEYLQQYVNQIYDHHYDEGYHTHVQIRNIAYDSSKKVALVGSTCTLVTEELQHVLLQQEYGRVTTTTTKREIHPTLSLALLSVILLDTMNMNLQAGRGTQRDQHSIDFLIQYTCWDFFLYPQKEEGEKAKKNDFVQSKFSNFYSQIFIHEKNINTNRVVPNCTALYELLQNCKFDEQFWLELSIEDTLRIDYKTFTHNSKKNKESSSSSSLFTTFFGLSSILLSCSTLQEKNHFIISTLDFIQQQQIQLLGILSLVIDKKTNIPKREILFFGPENIIQSLIQYLMTREDASFLNLYDTNNTTTTTARFHSKENTINPKIYIHETGDTDDRFMIITLQQGNSKASRKQIAPVIQSFFSSIG
jgi:inorganic pyrophosphatase/exopolyphosphatase